MKSPGDPLPNTATRSRLAAFMARHGISSYDDLLRRSTHDLEWFWQAVFDDLGIEFYEPYQQLLDTSRGIAWARWCIGGRLNIVHNCLDKWMGTAVEHKAALRWEGEEGITRALTYGELYAEVNRCANAFRELGVRKGRSRRAVHAHVPGAHRVVLRDDQARRESSCRCSPDTAPRPQPHACAMRKPRSSSPPTASGDAARLSR